MTYMARDFLETDEGLYFAVVENGLEDGVVLSSLRYVTAGGRPRKLSTREAKAFLSARHPEYLFRSVRRDVELHGVPEPRVRTRHDPRVRAARVRESAADLLEARARLALSMLEEAGVPPTSVGLTGSLLIRAHSEHSDIDLVIYDRSAFERARDFVGSLPAEAGMSDALWREAYRRRGCALSFSEYVRHESRKHNKLVVEGAKVDLGLVLAGPPDAGIWQKVALTEIVAEVDDDQRAFEHPARYHVRHPEIFEIVSYTPTFAGQARPGEFVAARGWKERSEDGRARLLIGTSREAGGEFIRVVSETGEPR